MKRIKIILDNKTQYDSCVKMLERYFEFEMSEEPREYPQDILFLPFLKHFTNLEHTVCNNAIFDVVTDFYNFKYTLYSVLNSPIV